MQEKSRPGLLPKIRGRIRQRRKVGTYLSNDNILYLSEEDVDSDDEVAQAIGEMTRSVGR